MKNLITLLFIVALGTTTYAQDFEKGGNYITIGYGVNGQPGYISGSHKSAIGPVIFTYERGITDVLGIGRIGIQAGFAFTHYSYDNYNNGYWGNHNWHSNYYKNVNRLSLLVKAPYHFEFDVDGLDFYAGAGIETRIDSRKYDYYNHNNGLVEEDTDTDVSIGVMVFAGARWYFTESFGVYLEAGYGVSNVNGGVVFAF